MAPTATKQDVSFEKESTEFDDLTDFEKSCMYVTKECDHHEKLLEAVQLLAKNVKDMGGCEMSQLKKVAEIYIKIEKILSLLGDEKSAFQTTILDQLLDELQRLKNSSPSPPPAVDQWKRLARIEENLVYVMADLGHDILTAVEDIHSRVGALAAGQESKPAENQLPKYSKQLRITKYLQFLQKIPSCVGKCHCNAPLEQTYQLIGGHHCQNFRQLDRQIHIGSPLHLYEVCPIEMRFQIFESAKNVRIIINFAALSSYTNYISSIFLPSHDGPVPVQIPWMWNMNNVSVLGKVTAEMRFSEDCQPITFQMNVIDWTNKDERVVIFGRDFVEDYVNSVYHDRQTVLMKNSKEGRKVFQKKFNYLTDILSDIKNIFCRNQLKNELKDSSDIMAGIDRLQKVLDQRDAQTSYQSSRNQAKDLKSSTNEQNAKKPDRETDSERQNTETDVLKSSGEVKDEKDQIPSSQSGTAEQEVVSQSSVESEAVKPSSEPKNLKKDDSSLTSAVLKDKVPNSQLEIDEKQIPSSSSPVKDVEKEDLKKSEQSRNTKKEVLTSTIVPTVLLKREPKPNLQTKNVEKKVSNPSSSSPSKSSEKKVVKPSSQPKNIGKDSKPSLQLKKVDEKEAKPNVKSQDSVKKLQDSEVEVLETKSKPKNQEVDSKHLIQTENIKKAALVSTNARGILHRMNPVELGELEPSDSGQRVHQEKNLKPSKIENIQKEALDPTRSRPPVGSKKVSSEENIQADALDPSRSGPPVFSKKESSEETESVSFLHDQKEVLKQTIWTLHAAENVEMVRLEPIADQKNKDPKVKEQDSFSLDQKKVLVEEKNKPPSEPENTEKEELKLISLSQNIDKKKEDLKLLELVQTSVIKNPAQKKQIAESCSEENITETVNSKGNVIPQNINEEPKTKV